MKNTKTRILAATMLSAITLSQPPQIKAVSLSTNQKTGLGMAEWTAALGLTGMGAKCVWLEQIVKPRLRAYKAALDNTQARTSHEQITVKKGDIFTIERVSNTAAGQRWALDAWSDSLSPIGLAGATENPGQTESLYFSFKAKEVGTHTVTFINTHRPVEMPLGNSTVLIRFVDRIVVTVNVEDTENSTALKSCSCPIEISGTEPPYIYPNNPRDLYICVDKQQEFIVTAHKKTDTLQYDLSYENLAPNRVERLEDRDVFYFTAPMQPHSRLRIYLEEYKKDGSKAEDLYRIIVING